METIAVIPARGGSKGLPGKNIISLCGKPLIAWTIEAAQKVSEINRIVVSTDDTEIARVAKLHGAEVVIRPDEFSHDTAASEFALLHVLEHLESRENYSPDIVLFLQCTSPLTLPEDIRGTWDTLVRSNADCAFTVASFNHFLWKAAEKGESMVGVNHDLNQRLMRQQRKSEFIETGAAYAINVTGFKKAKHRFFGKIVTYVVPKSRLLEIDEVEDLERAQQLMTAHIRKQQSRLLPEQLEAIILDFDGVLTDNKVLVSEDGKEAVMCNRSDGLALSELKKTGIPIVVISTEKNKVVQARCLKLGIECYHGVDDKLSLLLSWAQDNEIELTNSIFIGNDTNDTGCLENVGCPIVVGDASSEVKSIAKIVLHSNGGDGVIRELMKLLGTTVTEYGNV